jgi:hypothetical protein
MFKKLLKGIGQAVIPAAIALAAPQAMINTAVFGGVKNATAIPNNAIPVINMAASSGISYVQQLMSGVDPIAAIMPAVQDGGLLTALSTGLHQSIKVPVKMQTGRSI